MNDRQQDVFKASRITGVSLAWAGLRGKQRGMAAKKHENERASLDVVKRIDGINSASEMTHNRLLFFWAVNRFSFCDFCAFLRPILFLFVAVLTALLLL
jgi:hypothetical protein